MQSRRRYLHGSLGTALLVGLAGCIGGDDDETRPTGTGGPGVSIASVTDDLDIPIDVAVELVRDAATAEQPPRLRTTLTNTSDEPVQVGEGRAVHFEYVNDTDGLLTLLPAASPDEYPVEPDCWRLTDGIAITEEYRTFELAAGESQSRDVDLYATQDADGCLPVGEYSFETTVSIVDDEAAQEASATWGFSLTLE
ncbi:hypothetical protein EGH24_02905 [Halonotius terrestris]|uniref:DUF8130 domain-containing protein n=1 Tax=Halonotius terrestris TaxID=2487750 RepID=A0A8J8PC10_9EURY|nr:hypothetical protein [Halonotius terrestris]TQQ83748.1 hypothetical protein EGH24_02905 [Halonotius terrestris]